jgi:hypothetical protein
VRGGALERREVGRARWPEAAAARAGPGRGEHHEADQGTDGEGAGRGEPWRAHALDARPIVVDP